MVTFCCGKCNESLKKSKVEQHYYRCRNDYVTCIDCNTDFGGDEFNTHVKCVSEAERYGGVGFKAKANKGEVKQNSWIEQIQGAADNPNLSANAKRVMEVIGANENIPRKKKKFDNFVKNTCRFAFQGVINEIWEAISALKPEPVKQEPVKKEEPVEAELVEADPESKDTEKDEENRTDDSTEIKAEVNSAKRKCADEETTSPDKKQKVEWKWSREIKEALKSMDDSSCKIKTLRKQVFKKAEENDIEALDKDEFLAKLKKVKKIVINEENNTVSL